MHGGCSKAWPALRIDKKLCQKTPKASAPQSCNSNPFVGEAGVKVVRATLAVGSGSGTLLVEHMINATLTAKEDAEYILQANAVGILRRSEAARNIHVEVPEEGIHASASQVMLLDVVSNHVPTRHSQHHQSSAESRHKATRTGRKRSSRFHRSRRPSHGGHARRRGRTF